MTGDDPNHRNRWFEKRSDFFVRQVIEDFFRLVVSFQDVYLIYLECRDPWTGSSADLCNNERGESRARLWDRLTMMVGSENEKGPLWRLKDLCHLVWPENDEHEDVSGDLVDWLVGSIFHESMKLKENIYLLNRYGPAAYRMRKRPTDLSPFSLPGSGPVAPLDNMIDVQGVLNRAASDAHRQIEQIAFLFSHTSYMLRLMMPDLARNMLVARLLVEQEDQVKLLWGEALEDIFQDMFFGDVAEGFCAIGRSYLSGQWFPQALAMYQRALAVDATCDEAIIRMVQLQAVVKENRQLFDVL